MADRTKIEWTDATWNPVRGCTRVSPGCVNCYAERVAARFSGEGLPYHGLAEMRGGKARWTGTLSFGHDLDAPLRWRQPRRIFVNSMSDLFMFDMEEVATVFAIAVAAHLLRGHVLQFLTKRSAAMRAMLAEPAFWDHVNAEASAHVMDGTDPLNRRSDDARARLDEYGPEAAPPGLWLGVSAEDQRRADERIPDLRATPAQVRFLSAEPLLGPLDVTRYMWPVHASWPARYRSVEEARAAGAHVQMRRQGLVAAHCTFLDWVIVGGESGPGARPMHPQWARDIRDQCAAAGVPFHFKQWGEWAPSSLGADVCRASREERIWCDGEWTGHAISPRQANEPDTMNRVCRARAGRLLDGIAHDGMPGAVL